MKITKLGHCCLLIEENGLRILTDPGSYTVEEQKNIKNIDVVLITHDHADHLHIESLKTIIKNNPESKIFTNQDTSKVLEKEGIVFKIIGDQQSAEVNNVLIEGFGSFHAEMYRDIPQTANTGYFIADKFFYPGDAFTIPNRPVEILAVPTAGPWMKLSEGIEYAISVKPKKCFPVHDGILKNISSTNRIPAQILLPLGIEFIIPELGKEMIF